MTDGKCESVEAKLPGDGRREPTKLEAKAIEKAVRYCRKRTQPLAYEITRVEGSDIEIDIPHSDAGGFLALQRATFGTVSSDFAARSAATVADLARGRGQDRPKQDQMNAGVAAVAAIEPQDEVEAMLAIQMFGTHSLAADMLVKAKQAKTTDEVERYGTLATKMLRTYTAQIEALSRLRRGGEQKVTVEHVHVYEGGQAIVGNVNSPDAQPQLRGGGRLENGHQPHAPIEPRALAVALSQEVLRPDAGRNSVPVASGGRESAVPDARRGRRKRGAQG